MATASSFSHHNMDPAHLDDKMEIGTSPYPHPEDIDVDLNPIPGPSVDNNMLDDTDFMTYDGDTMQDDGENIYRDDDMVYDEVAEPEQNVAAADLNMEFSDHNNHDFQDDEILYDEEEIDSTQTIDQSARINEDLEYTHITTDQGLSSAEGLIQEPAQEEDIRTIDSGNTNHTTQGNDMNGTGTTLEATYIPDDGETATDETAVHEIAHSSAEIVDFANTGRRTSSNNNADFSSGTGLQQSGHKPSTTEAVAAELVQDALEKQPQTINSALDESKDLDFDKGITMDTNQESINVANPEIDDDVTNDVETSLHPINIVYLDQEMSLFPPTEQDTSTTFFLADTNLAFEPIDRLLLACREILGESLEHDDELVLDLPALGLHICEDSKYSSNLTLSQVLDVYTTLKQNEQNDHIEPLTCTLSSRVCLASQYAYLSSSAYEGRTYTEIAADYVPSPEPEVNEREAQTEAADGEYDPEQNAVHSTDQENLDPNETHEHPKEIGKSTTLHEPHMESDQQAELEVQEVPADDSKAPLQGASSSGGDMVDSEVEVHTQDTLPQEQSGVPGTENDDDSDSLPANGDAHEDNHNSQPTQQEHESAVQVHSVSDELEADDDSVSSHTVAAEEADQADASNGDLLPESNDHIFDDDVEPRVGYEDDEEHLLVDEPIDEVPAISKSNESTESNVESANGVHDVDAEIYEIDELEFQDSDINVEKTNGVAQSETLEVLGETQSSENISAVPTTPSKNVKRKTIEEDEDLFAANTPEPKRRRPS